MLQWMPCNRLIKYHPVMCIEENGWAYCNKNRRKLSHLFEPSLAMATLGTILASHAKSHGLGPKLRLAIKKIP